jgi:hypothetical protein
VLAFKDFGRVARHEAFGRMALPYMVSVKHVFQHGWLNDQIIQVHHQQLRDTDAGEYLHCWVFLRVLDEMPNLVLNDGGEAGTKKLGRYVYIQLSAVRPDTARRGADF